MKRLMRPPNAFAASKFAFVVSRMRCARSHASSSVGPEDRPERDADARHVRAARRLGLGAHAGDLLGRLGERLAPERVHVRVLAADAVGRVGGAAEVERDARRLRRAQVAPRVLEVVEAPVVVVGGVRRPGQLEDVEVLVGARVALVLDRVVAVARHLGVAAARDDVDRDAPARELVERDEGARRERGGEEARPVRDQEAEALGDAGAVRGDLHAVGLRRARVDQDLVEAGVLVRDDEAARVVDVNRRARCETGLRDVLRVDHPNELDGHRVLLASRWRGRCGPWRAARRPPAGCAHGCRARRAGAAAAGGGGSGRRCRRARRRARRPRSGRGSPRP